MTIPLPLAQAIAEGRGLIAPEIRERDVGPPGVSSQPRPLGLAVADEPDPSKFGIAASAHAEVSSTSGRTASDGPASKDSRGLQRKSHARITAGTVAIFVL